MNRFIHTILLAVALAACSPIQAQRGQMLTDDDIAKLRVGEIAKPEVLALLGTPTVISTFDENQWYYVGQDTEQIGFDQPETKERRVVALQFDETGILRAKDTKALQDGKMVYMKDDKTRVLSQEPTVIQQLIGNVGRFSATGEGDKK